MAEPGLAGPADAPPLRVLFWESTARCNLTCAHCRRDKADTGDELPGDDVRRLLEEAARLGPPLVVFSGGEPLLRDDWQPLAAHARSLGLNIALATNGTLIDDAAAGRIREAGFRRVAVSLDGADAATHDAVRGPGAFEAATAGIAALRRAGQPVQINATLSRANAGQLDALVDLSRSVEAEALHLFVLVPVGCGVDLAKTQQLPPRQYVEVLGRVLDLRQSGRAGLELRPTCAPQYHRLAGERGAALPGRGCLCGVSVLFVGHDGTVRPCGYLPVDCGTIRRQRLDDIWRGSTVLRSLRDADALGGACGQCDWRFRCGGCRARAYAATGDYLAAEPGCPFAPAQRPAAKGVACRPPDGYSPG